ncbi:SHOCT domain-containing protein [Flavobacterium sp.]|uniref:SHOCT domain-containing protein n=1 Tax=Flavobacterium sp. TaxID=239 RepID=UPI0037521C0C
MYYENYHLGINIIWWALWAILLIWILGIPYNTSRRHKRHTASYILQKRYVSGDITKSEYYDKQKILIEDGELKKT